MKLDSEQKYKFIKFRLLHEYFHFCLCETFSEASRQINE